MSAREEEHGYEAIIKALMKALTDIKGSPMDSLKGDGELVHTPRYT